MLQQCSLFHPHQLIWDFLLLCLFLPTTTHPKSHLVLLSCRHHRPDFTRQSPLPFSLWLPALRCSHTPSQSPSIWAGEVLFLLLLSSSKSIKSYQLQQRRKACWVSEATKGQKQYPVPHMRRCKRSFPAGTPLVSLYCPEHRALPCSPESPAAMGWPRLLS